MAFTSAFTLSILRMNGMIKSKTKSKYDVLPDPHDLWHP